MQSNLLKDNLTVSYRFVLMDTEEIGLYDPDMIVEWEKIVQVVIFLGVFFNIRLYVKTRPLIVRFALILR
jgi:hypothetical protein